MKNKRKLLVSSFIMIISCCLLFAGTTFAWFSDSVSSNNNIITAGNLDVELEYSTDGLKWTPVNSETSIFKEETLWEPGHTEAVLLKVSNAGTLALKYGLTLEVTEDKPSTNVYGDQFKISDFLLVGALVSDTLDASTVQNRTAAKQLAEEHTIGFSQVNASQLLPEKADYVQLVVYMPESVGNEANHAKGVEAPSVKFGINLVATQVNHEEDSFGSNYDGAAKWLGGVNTDWYFENPEAISYTLESAEELAGLAALVNGTATAPITTYAATETKVQDSFKGKTIILDSDINLDNRLWTPIGTDKNPFLGDFDGKGHTVYNLNVKNEGWSGLIGHAGKGNKSTIKNVNIINATIETYRMAGALVGQLYGYIDNCHVENAKITATANLVGSSYDNGDKIGGIVGWLGDNNNFVTLTNSSVKNVDIKGYRDLGGLAGYVAYSTTISNNTITNVDVIADQTVNNYGYKDPNIGVIWGRNSVSNSGVGVTSENNTVNQTELNSLYAKYVKDGIQYISYADGSVRLYLVPADYEETTVVLPEGVTEIGGYAFAYNTNIEKIVLPSTVTTLNDRAFRDTSASEVVLNEGLTNISYQAFRNALNLKKVVIPSTVTTIGKEVFQNSGVTELVVPATVKSIEYGCFKDMKELESVIFEGNVEIPVYAFRACTKLKTVVLKGEDVTFAGKGMIFTNKENGDGSAMAVYVANETVKERLLENDTAAKDYGGYKIVVGNTAFVATEAELVAALAAGKNVILTSDIDMEAATIAPYGNKYGIKHDGGVIDGNGHALHIEVYGDDYGIMTSGGTIRNIKLDAGCRAIMVMYAKEDIILDNVYVCGDDVLYPINTGEYAVVEGVKLIVSNSQFGGWTSFAGIESASFTNCTFIVGEYGYGWPYDCLVKPYVNTTFKNCEFTIDEDGNGYYLDLSSLGAGCKVTLENCTAGGTKITAANYNNLLGEVELPGGRELADCVIFK